MVLVFALLCSEIMAEERQRHDDERKRHLRRVKTNSCSTLGLVLSKFFFYTSFQSRSRLLCYGYDPDELQSTASVVDGHAVTNSCCNFFSSK